MKTSKCRTFFVAFSLLLVVAALLAIGIVTAKAGANTIDNILPDGGLRYTRLDTLTAVSSSDKAESADPEAFADLSTLELLNRVLSFEDVGGYVMFKSTRTYTETDVTHIAKDNAFLALVAREDYADVLELFAASRQDGENIGAIASEALPYVTLHPMTLAALRGRTLTPEFACYIRTALDTVGLTEK